MTIEWNSSAGPTLGVEWEVQLVDARTRMLRQDAGQVLAGLPGLLESGEHIDDRTSTCRDCEQYQRERNEHVVLRQHRILLSRITVGRERTR